MIQAILSILPVDFSLPILIAQHLHNTDDGRFAQHLSQVVSLPVVESSDKQPIQPGQIYTAPANYHMLVERDRSIALSVDAKINWSRPSIDVLFESAARVWGERLISVLLTGANSDGAKGTETVKRYRGTTIAQDPATAEYPAMPQSAIDTEFVDEILCPEAIGQRLKEIGFPGAAGARSSSGENANRGRNHD